MMNMYFICKVWVGVDISSYALYIPCMYKRVNMGLKKTCMSMVHFKVKKDNYLCN
jgi:hypothetical protein